MGWWTCHITRPQQQMQTPADRQQHSSRFDTTQTSSRICFGMVQPFLETAPLFAWKRWLWSPALPQPPRCSRGRAGHTPSRSAEAPQAPQGMGQLHHRLPLMISLFCQHELDLTPCLWLYSLYSGCKQRCLSSKSVSGKFVLGLVFISLFGAAEGRIPTPALPSVAAMFLQRSLLWGSITFRNTVQASCCSSPLCTHPHRAQGPSAVPSSTL